jgi:hypothetical protein
MTQGPQDEDETPADREAANAAAALTGQAPHPYTGEPDEPAKDEPQDDPERPDAESPGTPR